MHDADGTVRSVYEFGIFIARARLPARRGVAHVDELGNAARYDSGFRIAQALQGKRTALIEIGINKAVQRFIRLKVNDSSAVEIQPCGARIHTQKGNFVCSDDTPCKVDFLCALNRRFHSVIGDQEIYVCSVAFRFGKLNDNFLGGIARACHNDAEGVGIFS